ncbi:MAG: AAA family ATPase, partial [Actinomycetota bacterium]|nr:AAA family ATPase [Actinomycetota bacterium]
RMASNQGIDKTTQGPEEPGEPSGKRPRRAPRPQAKRFFGTLGFWVALLTVLLLVAFVQTIVASRPQVDGARLTFKRFVDLAEGGRIESARILDFDSYVVGTYRRRDLKVVPFNVPYLKTGGSRQPLLDVLLENGIAARIDQQYGKQVLAVLQVALPTLLLILVFGYVALSARRGTGLFAVKNPAQRAGAEETTTRFSDTAAQDEAVTELRELAQFLSAPKRFTSLGARIPSGVLLYGPPGCGKTLLAKALAGESGAAFYSISGSDFVELYVGVGAARVRELFKEAREDAPSIVFIDEIDAIGRRRRSNSASDGSSEEQNQALNQILTEMDGFSDDRLGTIVVGATNRPDDLDPALLRPGRFDRAISVDRPDEAGRLAILQVHARGKPLGPETDLASIANRAIGMTGADLATVMNEAALLTARAGREEISQAQLEGALTRILEAPERQRRLSVRDRSLGQRSLADERVTFDDVAGIEEALEELNEVKHFLTDPGRYVELGARFPRGFLLIGPPGTGKTLLARAVAGESNAAFLTVAATEFTEVFVGEGAARVRDLFSEARSVAPTIVFIDEIDAIGTIRQGSSDGHREREQTLNQILIELDGFRQRDGVIVMAATNRYEILDPALVRPGRFDRTITLGLPDRAGRHAILEVHADGKNLAPDVDLDALAGATRGLSGAELANVVNEATLLTARQGKNEVTMACLDEAVGRVSLGISRAHILSDDERQVVAYHEAGHAVTAWSLPEGKLPHKITIIPNGRALGQAWLTETRDRLIHSRSILIDEMATLLGGRVAEELVFGQPGSGAADDLARVAEIARTMVRELGMSKTVGALAYVDGDGQNGHGASYSDETARLLDAEARAFVAEAEGRARELLEAGRDGLDRVAELLLEREVVSSAEIEDVIGGAPARAGGS